MSHICFSAPLAEIPVIPRLSGHKMTLPNPQVSSTCSNWVGSFRWCDWRDSNSHGDLPAELKSAASANSATIAFGVAAGDRTQRKTCLRRSRMPIPPRQHMEQVTRIELASSAWRADALTVRRYLQISRGDESREVRLPCQAVCVSGVCSRTYNFLRTVRIGRGDRI